MRRYWAAIWIGAALWWGGSDAVHAQSAVPFRGGYNPQTIKHQPINTRNVIGGHTPRVSGTDQGGWFRRFSLGKLFPWRHRSNAMPSPVNGTFTPPPSTDMNFSPPQ
ncbi:MAG: hypothetical protein ACK4RK_18730 [Gemmataceae bacterium]